MEASIPTREDELARKRADAAKNGSDEPDLEGQDDEEQAEPQIALEGLGKTRTSSSGGRKPDKASTKLSSRSIEIPSGQYDKGDVVDLLIRVRCAEIHFIDHEDETTGQIIDTERKHVFKIKSVERINDK